MWRVKRLCLSFAVTQNVPVLTNLPLPALVCTTIPECDLCSLSALFINCEVQNQTPRTIGRGRAGCWDIPVPAVQIAFFSSGGGGRQLILPFLSYTDTLCTTTYNEGCSGVEE